MTIAVWNEGILYPRNGWVRFVNCLTLSRFAMGFVIASWHMLIKIGVLPAPNVIVVTAVIAAALITDCEGIVARRRDAKTESGAAFDPIADGSLFIGIGIGYLLQMRWSLTLAIIYGTPILGLITYALYAWWLRRRGIIKESSHLAKTNIVAIGCTIMLSYASKAFGLAASFEELALWWLWIAFGWSLITLTHYWCRYLNTLKIAAVSGPYST